MIGSDPELTARLREDSDSPPSSASQAIDYTLGWMLRVSVR
jgi:hypothetical protein